MSTTTNLVGIKGSWSLLAFAQKHGKMKIAPFTNSETGETFRSCAFIDPENNITLVGFSRNLGELTPAEIKAQKNDLQVVLLASGSYKLCNTNSSWKDVDLGI